MAQILLQKFLLPQNGCLLPQMGCLLSLQSNWQARDIGQGIHTASMLNRHLPGNSQVQAASQIGGGAQEGCGNIEADMVMLDEALERRVVDVLAGGGDLFLSR